MHSRHYTSLSSLRSNYPSSTLQTLQALIVFMCGRMSDVESFNVVSRFGSAWSARQAEKCATQYHEESVTEVPMDVPRISTGSGNSVGVFQNRLVRGSMPSFTFVTSSV
jgi:hypothetical protein